MNFQYNYNLSGSSRKPLIEAMSQMLDQPAVYQGAPSFSYTIGDFTVNRNGVLSYSSNIHPDFAAVLVKDLRDLGFAAEETAAENINEATDADAADGTNEAADARGEDSMAETETDGAVPEETPESSETTENSSMQETVQSDDTPGQLTVEVPSAGFTPETLENLKKIVASKKTVLEKALGSGGLPIIERDGRLIFPWFTLHGLDGEADAYSRLITAICKMAKNQKRVTAVERPVENAKFAMRLFLVRLGFVGDEYKTARRILLRNLTGNGSWKSGHRPERDTNAVIPPSPEDAALTAAQAFTAPLEEADATENSLHKEDEGDDSYGK